MKLPKLRLDRVLLREIKAEEVMAGTLVIAGANSVGDVRRGEVLAHGPGYYDENSVFHPLDDLKRGDKVFYHNHKAVEMPLGGMTSDGATFMTNARDIIGVIEG